MQSTPVRIVLPFTRSGQERRAGGIGTARPSAPTAGTSWLSGTAAFGIIAGSNVQRGLNRRASWLTKLQRLGRPGGRVRATALMVTRTHNEWGGMLDREASQ